MEISIDESMWMHVDRVLTTAEVILLLGLTRGLCNAVHIARLVFLGFLLRLASLASLASLAWLGFDLLICSCMAWLPCSGLSMSVLSCLYRLYLSSSVCVCECVCVCVWPCWLSSGLVFQDMT